MRQGAGAGMQTSMPSLWEPLPKLLDVVTVQRLCMPLLFRTFIEAPFHKCD